MTDIFRRQFAGAMLETAATVGILRLALGSGALAAPAAQLAEKWAAGVVEMAFDLRARHLPIEQWHEAVAALHRQVPLEQLLSYIDFDRLKPLLEEKASGEYFERIRLPGIDSGDRRIWTALFVLPEGAAIPPHGHNNIVSAHLLLQGRFRARTYDRIEDMPGRMLLRPAMEKSFAPGETVAMSDERDNVHWFIAEQGPVFTFDISLRAPDLRVYHNPVERDGRIFIDPTTSLRPDGTIEAPVIDYRTSAAKFGRAIRQY